MTCQELATCVEHDIDVKVFIMNNGYLGHGPPVAGALLGQALQRRRHGLEPRLGQARRGVRRDAACASRRTTRSRTRCATAIETEGPVVLDVHVRKEENCYPMIPAGAAARDMVGGEEGEATSRPR